MKNHFSLLFLILLMFSCSTDKIPVTTSSEKALEYYLKGLDFSERLRRLDAIEFFDKAIELDTNFALAYLNRGYMKRLASDRIADFNKAIEKRNNASHAERLLIDALEASMNGFPKKAEQYYRQLAGDFPNDEKMQSILGNFLFNRHEYEEAIKFYLRALEINPKFSQAYNQLGYAYRYLGNYVKAEDSFKKYINLIPDDPNPYDSYAELLLKMGEYEVSIEMYEKALKLDPSFVFSYTGIATNLNLKHEHEEARKVLMNLFRTARDDGDRRLALISIAISYVDEEKPEDALRVLEKSYKMAENQGDIPEMASSIGIMGDILFEYGKTEEAIEKYQESRRLLATSDLSDEIKTAVEQNYLHVTARIQVARGNLDEAENTVARYKSRAEETENSLQLLEVHELTGIIAYHRNEYDKAIEEFNQANQQSPYLAYRIAETYLAKGDKKEALHYFTKSAEFNMINSLGYAFVRKKAERKALQLKSEIAQSEEIKLNG